MFIKSKQLSNNFLLIMQNYIKSIKINRIARIKTYFRNKVGKTNQNYRKVIDFCDYNQTVNR